MTDKITHPESEDTMSVTFGPLLPQQVLTIFVRIYPSQQRWVIERRTILDFETLVDTYRENRI